jgi:hypothetical protein
MEICEKTLNLRYRKLDYLRGDMLCRYRIYFNFYL